MLFNKLLLGTSGVPRKSKIATSARITNVTKWNPDNYFNNRQVNAYTPYAAITYSTLPWSGFTVSCVGIKQLQVYYTQNTALNNLLYISDHYLVDSEIGTDGGGYITVQSSILSSGTVPQGYPSVLTYTGSNFLNYITSNSFTLDVAKTLASIRGITEAAATEIIEKGETIYLYLYWVGPSVEALYSNTSDTTKDIRAVLANYTFTTSPMVWHGFLVRQTKAVDIYDNIINCGENQSLVKSWTDELNVIEGIYQTSNKGAGFPWVGIRAGSSYPNTLLGIYRSSTSQVGVPKLQLHASVQDDDHILGSWGFPADVSSLKLASPSHNLIMFNELTVNLYGGGQGFDETLEIVTNAIQWPDDDYAIGYDSRGYEVPGGSNTSWTANMQDSILDCPIFIPSEGQAIATTMIFPMDSTLRVVDLEIE